MNRTIMILHLLVSISVAKPIGENPSPILEGRNYKTDDLLSKSPDEIEDVFSVLVKKDDILTASDITRIYNLLENKLGKIRSLKEEPENEGYKNAELDHQSRAAVKSKSAENVNAEDKSDTDQLEEIKNKTANREESELEERSGYSDKLINTEDMAPIREESKVAEKILFDVEPPTKEESKSETTNSRTIIARLEENIDATEAEDFVSKASTKEKRKSEVTRDLNELKSPTDTFRAEDNSPEYLENYSDISKADSRRNRNGNFNNVIKGQNTPIDKSESYPDEKEEINDRSAPKDNSRNSYGNDKVENNDKHAPKEDSRSSYVNAKVETNNKQASKEESRSGYQNDKGESNSKTASKEDKNRKGYEMPINDESNSSWDLLDDIPISRRMLTHDNVNIENKAKAADEDVKPEEDRNVPEPKPIASRNENSYGPTTLQYDRTVLNPELRSTVSIPQYQSTIPNPQLQRTVLNPQFQNTGPSQQIQTGWNPYFQSSVPNPQFPTTLNPQTQNTVPSRKIESTVLNPQFPSTFLNSQFPTVPNLQFQSTVSIPHIHPSLLPTRRFIIPGIIKIHPAQRPYTRTAIDYRRLYSQEENNNQHRIITHKTERNPIENDGWMEYRSDEKSEIPESREFNIEDNSNAYPYTPVGIEKEKTPQIAMVNPIFSKLAEASQHPHRFNPNFNGGNVQNIPYKKLNRFQLF